MFADASFMYLVHTFYVFRSIGSRFPKNSWNIKERFFPERPTIQTVRSAVPAATTLLSTTLADLGARDLVC